MCQEKSSLKFLTLGLFFVLTACSGVEASQPASVKQAPVEVKPEEIPVDQSQPQVEAVTGIEAAKEVDNTPAMTEKPAKIEPAQEKAMATSTEEVEDAEAKPAVITEATPEKGEMVVETAPAEDKAMAEPASSPGPTEAQLLLLAGLQNRGAPPELLNEVWLNSEPLKLADLHGQVVIVEFWTYGCINCIHVIPSLREWHQAYADEGLVIIGVHTPEFNYERDLDNVKQALVDLDVPYPVAIDNDWQTWRTYNNHYWPAKYFIDKAGNIRHIHIGEGRYQQQEEIIQALLAEQVTFSN
jgi:thiol-disulfide isomerase/thioredoxin